MELPGRLPATAAARATCCTVAVFAAVTREELKPHLDQLGREAAARGPVLKGVTDLFRLYWLALQHGLVVEGLEHTWAEGCGKCDPLKTCPDEPDSRHAGSTLEHVIRDSP